VVDAADASACGTLEDPTGYTHTWQPPNVQKGKCSATQLDAFKTEYWGAGASAPSRTAFETNNPDCFACLISKATDPTRGALIHYAVHGDLFNGNVSGCVAIVDGDLSETGCGAQTQRDLECEEAACLPICVIQRSADVPAFDACFAAATKLPTCAPYFAA